MLVARASGRIDVLNIAKAEYKQRINLQEQSGLSSMHNTGIVALSSDATYSSYLTSSVDGAVGLWQWEGETLRLVESQASLRKMLFDGLEFGIEAWATALSASGDFFAASGEGAVLSFFSAKCGDFGMGLFSIALGAPADTFVLSLAFNADDSLLAVGTNKGDVYVVDVTERVVLVCLTDHSKPVRTVYFAPPTTSYADHLFVGSDDRIVSVHDVRYVRESLQASTITSLQGHTGWILDVQSGGDGRIVASSSSDGTIRLWDLGASPVACVATLSQTTPVWSLSWLRNEKPEHSKLVSTRLLEPGAMLVAVNDDGTVRLYRNAGAYTGRPQ